MVKSINSSNIINFGFTVKFDLFNRKVIFDTTNLTTYQGAGAGAIKGISFALIDQSSVVLAAIDPTFANPQLTNLSANKIYTLDLSSLFYSFLFQTYSIQGAIQEANGTIYYTDIVYKTVGSPTGFTDNGYVPGMMQLTADCVNNLLTIKELTPLVLNGLTPSSQPVKTGVLNYPTGTIAPVNFSNTPFSNNVIYTGRYNITCTTVAEYNLGDDVYVDVSYVTNQQFDVTCANRIADLMCCLVSKYKTYEDNCDTAIGKEALHQYNSVAPLIMLGIIKEYSGQDASSEAAKIKEILNCDCGSTSVGQNQQTPINPSINNIVLIGLGGTSIPATSVTGNTKQISILSNLYVVAKNDPSDAAYTITIDTSVPNTVKYKLSFNYITMATSILNAIGGSPTLLAQLNSYINSTLSLIGLNGLCVIDLSRISYSLSQLVAPSSIITGIVIDGTNIAAPANLNANSTAAIQTWLTSLNLGTFVVTITNSVLTILSANNTHVVSTLTFAAPIGTIQFQPTSVTFVSVLQAIINYICSLSALAITIGNQLVISSFDYNNNVVSATYAANTKQSDFNNAVSGAINNLVNRINALTGITCQTLKNIFVDNPNGSFISSTDRIYGTINGSCAGLNDHQLAGIVMAAIPKYADVLAAFCSISCSTPASCPDVAAINMSMVNTSVGIYGVTWNVNPTASQTVTVQYRVKGTTSWTVGTNNLSILPNGNMQGAPPYLIPGLTAGQTYDIWVKNNCGGSGFVSQITIPTAGIYSGSYKRDTVLGNLCADAPVTLYTKTPFQVGVTMYTDAGVSIVLTGFNYIADSTGTIYNISSTTGIVGAATGSNCSNGVAHSYVLGNATGSICTNSPQTLYTNGAFSVGSVLYTDSGLTNPVTGFSYVVNIANNHIYNLNSVTGAVGADTGLSCNSNTVIVSTDTPGIQIQSVSGIAGFTGSGAPFPLSAGGSATGTHAGFTAQISVVTTGALIFNPSGLVLTINGVIIQTIEMTGPGTFFFNQVTVAPGDLIRVDSIIGP